MHHIELIMIPVMGCKEGLNFPINNKPVNNAPVFSGALLAQLLVPWIRYATFIIIHVATLFVVASNVSQTSHMPRTEKQSGDVLLCYPFESKACKISGKGSEVGTKGMVYDTQCPCCNLFLKA